LKEKIAGFTGLSNPAKENQVVSSSVHWMALPELLSHSLEVVRRRFEWKTN
jgi:hypothetical protein